MPFNNEKFAQALLGHGLRTTRQREVVYKIIADAHDHPTADEIYMRCRQEIPSISLATVYNCLETLQECELIRQVNFERESTRYEPRHTPHAHFYCDESGKVVDVPLSESFLQQLKSLLPEGFDAQSIEINFRGKAPEKAHIAS